MPGSEESTMTLPAVLNQRRIDSMDTRAAGF